MFSKIVGRSTSLLSKRTVGGISKRKFTSDGGAAPLLEHMSIEKSGLPKHAESLPTIPPNGKVTTLPNGLKVATITSEHPVTSIGVFVRAGSRLESSNNAGVSFYLRQLGFASSKDFRAVRFVREIETLGATYSVESTREHIGYTAQTLSEYVPQITPTLLGVLAPRWYTNPKLYTHEVADAREQVKFLSEEQQADPTSAVFELLHQTAYRNQGLGRSSVTPSYNIENIDHQTASDFFKAHFIPQNIVVVANGGIGHDRFVELVSKHQTPAEGGNKEVNTPASHYVGGESLRASEGATHFILALQGVPFGHKDWAAASVLQALLGGGQSLFQNGPGHAQASRLNTNVVQPNNQWIYKASAFNISYSDSGLFGVYGVAQRGRGDKLANLLRSEVSRLSQNISNEEFARAVKVAQASFLFTHAFREEALEFVASQAFLGNNTISTPEQFAKSVFSSLKPADVSRVATAILNSEPTVVAIGDVDQVPRIQKL